MILAPPPALVQASLALPFAPEPTPLVEQPSFVQPNNFELESPPKTPINKAAAAVAEAKADSNSQKDAADKLKGMLGNWRNNLYKPKFSYFDMNKNKKSEPWKPFNVKSYFGNNDEESPKQLEADKTVTIPDTRATLITQEDVNFPAGEVR